MGVQERLAQKPWGPQAIEFLLDRTESQQKNCDQTLTTWMQTKGTDWKARPSTEIVDKIKTLDKWNTSTQTSFDAYKKNVLGEFSVPGSKTDKKKKDDSVRASIRVPAQQSTNQWAPQAMKTAQSIMIMKWRRYRIYYKLIVKTLKLMTLATCFEGLNCRIHAALPKDLISNEYM